MPDTKAVVETKAVPPVAAAYHFIFVPVATKFATVAEPQKDCALAVGADGTAIPVVTGEPDSQLELVPVKAKLFKVALWGTGAASVKVVTVVFDPLAVPWLNL